MLRTRSTISHRLNDWIILSEMLNFNSNFLASFSCKRRRSASVPVTERRFTLKSSLILNISLSTLELWRKHSFRFTFGLWIVFATKSFRWWSMTEERSNLPPIPKICNKYFPFNAPMYARVVFQGAWRISFWRNAEICWFWFSWKSHWYRSE